MKSLWSCCAFAALTNISCTGIAGSNADTKNRAGAIACEDTESCQQECEEDSDCDLGLYCTAAHVCGRDCKAGDDKACEDDEVCNSSGRCSSPTTPVRVEAPVKVGDVGTAGAKGLDDDCVRTVVRAKKATPTVMLIIDQSGSMRDGFDGGSRWDVLQRSLMDEPDGLVPALQSEVRFGLALYSAENSQDCPAISQVNPALDNFAAIATAYDDAEPMRETPTGDAIDAILDSLDVRLPAPDEAPRDPLVFVLATDGEPDRCEELNPQNGQEEALAAVRRAYELGVRTFVISVGDELTTEHHRDMANAGLGRDAEDPQADYWVAGDDASLRSALTEIIAGKLTCEITLNGRVEGGDACSGTVELNGTALPCDGDNGWQLVDPTHVQLNGRACEELKAPGGAQIDVSFPCEVEVLL